MKVKEFFRKGQEVWVITGSGIRRGKYIRLEDDNGHGYRTITVGELCDYRGEYGTLVSCDTFYESKVFSTKESAVNYFRSGQQEILKELEEHTSLFDVGEKAWRIDRRSGEIRSETVTSVTWRLGQFEYHTTHGGAAVYFERCDNYYKSREAAIEAYLSK